MARVLLLNFLLEDGETEEIMEIVEIDIEIETIDQIGTEEVVHAMVEETGREIEKEIGLEETVVTIEMETKEVGDVILIRDTVRPSTQKTALSSLISLQIAHGSILKIFSVP